MMLANLRAKKIFDEYTELQKKARSITQESVIAPGKKNEIKNPNTIDEPINIDEKNETLRKTVSHINFMGNMLNNVEALQNSFISELQPLGNMLSASNTDQLDFHSSGNIENVEKSKNNERQGFSKRKSHELPWFLNGLLKLLNYIINNRLEIMLYMIFMVMIAFLISLSKKMKNLLIIYLLSITLWTCTNRPSEDLLSMEERGDLAFARREYQTAVNLWSNSYSKNEKTTSLAKKIGKAYLKLGRFDKAESFLKKVADNNPDDMSTKINLAKVYILLWKLPEAEKICELLSENKIDDPELDLIRADINLMTNEIDKAENYYRKAIIGSKDSQRALMKLAIFLKSSNRLEEANEIFQIVQKNKKLSPQIDLLFADYYLLDNQYENAEKSVLQAIRTEPEDISLKYYLVKLYLARENNKKAEEILISISNNQDDKYHKLILADVYILNNKFTDAEKIITELKEKFPDPLAEFELLQGKYWLYKGKPVYATAHFKAALEFKPGLLNARYLLGITHLINGKVKLSENSLMGALQISPNHYKSLLLISELLYKKEEYDLSLSYIERLVEIYPENFEGRIIKGLNLIGLKKYDLAKEEFIKSTYLNQHKAYISYYYLGLIEELSENYTQAIHHYQKIIERIPELVDVSYRYCMILVKTGQNGVADNFIRQSLSHGDESYEKYYMAGKISLLIERKSEGETYLKRALTFNDAPGYIYIMLSNYYKNEGKFEKAVEILKECMIKKPDYPEAWIELSSLYVNRMELPMALEIIQSGYQKFQDFPDFQSNLAWLLLENHQDTDRALEIAQDAYEKNPDNAALSDTLGWAYYHKGIYSQAFWLLSDAEKKAPENGFIKYHLGMTYYQQGEIEKAAKYLKLALQSEESRFFSHMIDDTLNRIVNENSIESRKNKSQLINESILDLPEIEKNDEGILLPQWKQ
nr:tetratricopeptide repeat protein [Desulfobacula sp.]